VIKWTLILQGVSLQNLEGQKCRFLTTFEFDREYVMQNLAQFYPTSEVDHSRYPKSESQLNFGPLSRKFGMWVLTILVDHISAPVGPIFTLMACGVISPT